MYEPHMHLTELHQCGAVIQSKCSLNRTCSQHIFNLCSITIQKCLSMVHMSKFYLITQYTVYLHAFFSFKLHNFIKLSGGSDYTTRTPQTLVFDQNNMAFNITVPVLDNDIHEPVERFFGRLETEDGNTTLNPNSTLIRILDDDCKLHE